MNIILYDEKKIEAYNWEGVFYYSIYILVEVESIPNQDRGETKNISNKHPVPTKRGKLQSPFIGQKIKRKSL
jgi:hypothetical protein